MYALTGSADFGKRMACKLRRPAMSNDPETEEATMISDRMLQLRRIAVSIPDGLLNMAVVEQAAECGTARCLAGWATVDPWFVAQGITRVLRVGRQGRYIDWYELSAFFALAEYDTKTLFGAYLPRYMDPHAVSKAEVIANVDRAISGVVTVPYAAVPGLLA